MFNNIFNFIQKTPEPNKDFIKKTNHLIDDIQKKFDYEEHGGTPILGIKEIVIKCHGSSTKTSIKNAIYKANKCIETKFLEHMKNSFTTNNL